MLDVDILPNPIDGYVITFSDCRCQFFRQMHLRSSACFSWCIMCHKCRVIARCPLAGLPGTQRQYRPAGKQLYFHRNVFDTDGIICRHTSDYYFGGESKCVILHIRSCHIHHMLLHLDSHVCTEVYCPE